MKNDNPIATDSRTALDWPYHAGLVDRVLEKVEVKVKQKQRRRRRIIGGAAALAVVAFGVLWGVPFVRETSTVATIAAHRQTLAFADGSQADLNAQTSVHTDFRYGRRIVRLDQGEAFFSVAKDAEHPFLVETPAGTVRVTGTKFNVRLKDSGVEVTLLEGRVGFESGGSAPLRAELIPGQQFYSGGPDLRTLSAPDLENVTAWREGRLVLDGLTLGQAAARLGAFHGKEFKVSPDAAKLHPGGSVPLDDLTAALGALQDTLPIQVLPQGDGSVRIVSR